MTIVDTMNRQGDRGVAADGYAMRPARREDARRIAELYRDAADGVADYVWSGLALPGESVLDSGERRFARDNENFSWQNCVVAEHEGRIVGICLRYPVYEASPPPPPDFDPVLRPFAELEMSGSLYLAGVSVEPEHRGRGLGTRFQEEVFAHARGLGLAQVSGLIFEGNTVSRRVAERFGRRVVDRRQIVPHPLFRRTGEVLMYAGPVPPR